MKTNTKINKISYKVAETYRFSSTKDDMILMLISKFGIDEVKKQFPEEFTKKETYPVGMVFVGNTGVRFWVTTALRLSGVSEKGYHFDQLAMKCTYRGSQFDNADEGIPSNDVIKRFVVKSKDVIWNDNKDAFVFTRNIRDIGKSFKKWDGKRIQLRYTYFY